MTDLLLLAAIFLLGFGVGGLYGLHLGRRALRRVEEAYREEKLLDAGQRRSGHHRGLWGPR